MQNAPTQYTRITKPSARNQLQTTECGRVLFRYVMLLLAGCVLIKANKQSSHTHIMYVYTKPKISSYLGRSLMSHSLSLSLLAGPLKDFMVMRLLLTKYIYISRDGKTNRQTMMPKYAQRVISLCFQLRIIAGTCPTLRANI